MMTMTMAVIFTKINDDIDQWGWTMNDDDFFYEGKYDDDEDEFFRNMNDEDDDDGDECGITGNWPPRGWSWVIVERCMDLSVDN